MRRRSGTLLDLEVSILEVATEHAGSGEDFHGFGLAQDLQRRAGSQRLAAHGTLYKALDRLRSAGLLEAHWEDPEVAVAAGRPRRRLYRLTTAGSRALAKHQAGQPVTEFVRPQPAAGS